MGKNSHNRGDGMASQQRDALRDFAERQKIAQSWSKNKPPRKRQLRASRKPRQNARQRRKALPEKRRSKSDKILLRRFSSDNGRE